MPLTCDRGPISCCNQLVSCLTRIAEGKQFVGSTHNRDGNDGALEDPIGDLGRSRTDQILAVSSLVSQIPDSYIHSDCQKLMVHLLRLRSRSTDFEVRSPLPIAGKLTANTRTY
jgi:hypothetical protein